MRLTTDPAVEGSPAWSPDDRWIAFTRPQQGNVAIMLIPPLGGPERKLTEIAGSLAALLDTGRQVAGLQRAGFATRTGKHLGDQRGHRRASPVDHVCDPVRGRRVPFGRHHPGHFTGWQRPGVRPSGDRLRLRALCATADAGSAAEGRAGEGHAALRQRVGHCVDRQWPRDRVRGGRHFEPEPLAGPRVRRAGSGAPALRAPGRHHPAIAGSPPRLVYTWQSSTRTSGVWTSAPESARCSSARRIDNSSRSTPRTGARSRFNPTGAETWRSGLATRTARTVTDHILRRAKVRDASLVAGWPLAGSGLPCGGAARDLRGCRGRGQAAPHHSPPRQRYSVRAGRTTVFGSISPPTAAANTRSGKSPKDGGEAVQVTRSGGYAAFESPDGKYIYYSKFSRGRLAGSVQDAGAGRRGNAGPAGGLLGQSSFG